jgi:hypothetical protein
MSNKIKQSRRNFLQQVPLIGIAIPFLRFRTVEESDGSEEDNQTADSNINVKEGSSYNIDVSDKRIDIAAGIFVRSIDLSNNQMMTRSLQVNGIEILSGSSPEFQVTFSKAYPNNRPIGIKIVDDNKLLWADNTPVNNGTLNQPVEWRDQTLVNGEKLAGLFTIVKALVTNPKVGVTRLGIRLRSLPANRLSDVSVDLLYEIHDGYPAIRKWIEITNNGSQWLKIDNLIIDSIDLAPGFRSATPLTPEEQGAESSIISFSNLEYSCGIITASEIPSAPRKISKNGAMGYNDEYFEWVLGPSENFISEPVIHFAFNGSIIKSISGISTPLDRTIEGPFKKFLGNCIGLRGLPASIPAPLWCSYTNFLTDLTDTNMRDQADIAVRAGFVTFQLDEGWATTPSPGGSEPDISRFKDFDDTCRYITSKGLRLGLWISCFRGLDSKDIASLPDGRSLPPFTNTKRGFGMSFTSSWRNYFANDLVYMRDRYGMSYVKEDLTNISRGDISDSHESRTKKESYLRGLRGLLEANKRVADVAPEVWTQITHEIYWRTPGPPADIAALKYACSFHIPPNTYLGAGNGSKRVSQDWSYDPLKLRSDLIKSCWQARQRFFDHRGLPLYSIEFYAANAVNFKGSLTTEVQDRQICSWLMGTPMVFAGDLSSLSQENIEHYKKRFDLLKRLQATYNIYGYFQYSGVPVPTDTNWHWWGKLNNDGHGAVVVLRGSGGEPSQLINIPWIQTKRDYLISALFSNKRLGIFRGEELIGGKLVLRLPVFGQEILELSAIR